MTKALTLKHPIVMFIVVVLAIIGIGVVVLVATGTSGLKTTMTVSCVPARSDIVPVSARWDRVWANSAVHLKRGMFVGLEVVEGEVLIPPSDPSIAYSFPWTAPAVSTKGVLTATRECRNHGLDITSVPLAVYWFQAVDTGKVTVTVPLTKAWVQATRRGLVPRVQPLRVSVTVR